MGVFAGAKNATPRSSTDNPPPKLACIGAIRFFHRQGWEESLRIASVKVRWEEIVGKDMAENCSIYSFKNGRLVMRAHSTNWAQQLQLMMPQLEALFEREVGPGIVKSIKVRGPNADYTWQHGKLAVPGARGVRDTYG